MSDHFCSTNYQQLKRTAKLHCTIQQPLGKDTALATHRGTKTADASHNARLYFKPTQCTDDV